MKPFIKYPLGLHVKDDSVEVNLSPQIKQALYRLDSLVKELTGKHIVITSGSENTAKHSAKSKHYIRNNESGKGEAADIRFLYMFSKDQKHEIEIQFTAIVKNDLNDDFDFVIESDHWHLEYDHKKAGNLHRQ